MRQRTVVLVLAAGVWAGPVAPAAAPAGVVDPVVLTDKSVDCRTVDGIVKGLIKKGMTDEQKVLAVFHWVRLLLYHGDGPREYAYNFHHMINVYGHGSCLRQTTPVWVLLDRLGYKCRNAAIGGHHVMEVRYGGKWHLLDPHMNFYVYDRAKPATIASIEQIKADTTLVSDAVKEGRACPGFLLCGDAVSGFATRRGWRILGGFPESRKYTPVIEEPFGRITLRRGETYVRTWMPGKYWFRANWRRKNEGPHHGCGRRDRKDTVNWPVYEPHADGTRYRHWGAGYLLYEPDMTTDRYADGVVGRKNVRRTTAGGFTGLLAGEGGGEIVFSVGCPYVITAGELKLTPHGRAAPAAAVSIDGGKTWKPLELAVEGGKAGATFVEAVNGAHRGYRLRISIPAGAGIAAMSLKSHFQLNPYSLPYLVPGKNTVRAAAAAYGSPLTVTWKWAEGPQWKTAKSVSKTFKADGSLELTTPGGKHPRMKSLILSVAP